MNISYGIFEDLIGIITNRILKEDEYYISNQGYLGYYYTFPRHADYYKNVYHDYYDSFSDGFSNVYEYYVEDFVNKNHNAIKKIIVDYYMSYTTHEYVDYQEYDIKNNIKNKEFLENYFDDEYNLQAAFSLYYEDIYKAVLSDYVDATYNLAEEYFIKHPDFIPEV